MEESKKTWTIFKVYLLIASLVGLIGGLISLGIALTSLVQRLIITDNEYVNGQRYYEIESCKNPTYEGKDQIAKKPTDEEIKKCQTDKKEQLLLGRNVETKQTVLGGGIRAVLFIVLFFTHYPRFRKQDNA